jgi:hypothetical protein
VVQGRLFGMVQGKANQWIHALLPALLAALRALGDAPARSRAVPTVCRCVNNGPSRRKYCRPWRSGVVTGAGRQRPIGVTFPTGDTGESRTTSVPVPPMLHQQNLCRTLLAPRERGAFFGPIELTVR